MWYRLNQSRIRQRDRRSVHPLHYRFNYRKELQVLGGESFPVKSTIKGGVFSSGRGESFPVNKFLISQGYPQASPHQNLCFLHRGR
jgi:hypothetical protein